MMKEMAETLLLNLMLSCISARLKIYLRLVSAAFSQGADRPTRPKPRATPPLKLAGLHFFGIVESIRNRFDS